MSLGISAAAWAGIGTIGSLGMGLMKGGSSQSGNQTITQQNQIDPRIAQILFGDSGSNGLLSQYQSMLNRPQTPALQQYGTAAGNYLSNYGVQDMASQRQAANGMMAGGAQAPAQTGINLKSGYQDMIYGDPANNPYLTGAIQKGINQSNNAFQAMQNDATRNLTENVLPSIRGGAIAAGQYGSSRQGIAEGKALNDFSTQQQRAISQFGQNNTDAAVSAQAGAYDAGQNRALSALGSVAGQQQAANALNSANVLGGLQASSGLLNNAYTGATNQDAYDINRAAKVNGLLTPYMGVNSSSTTTQPLYENRAANTVGGLTGMLGLYNAFSGGSGGGGGLGGLLGNLGNLQTSFGPGVIGG